MSTGIATSRVSSVKVFLNVAPVDFETVLVSAAAVDGQKNLVLHVFRELSSHGVEVDGAESSGSEARLKQDQLFNTAEQCYAEIRERLGEKCEVNFLGSTQEKLGSQNYRYVASASSADSSSANSSASQRRCVYIKNESAPEEMRMAQAACEARAKELGGGQTLQNYQRLDYAELPWDLLLAKDYTSDADAHKVALAKKSLRRFYDLFDPQVRKLVEEIDRKKKLLLHVCCGPDAAGVVKQLKQEFDLTCFWYDPNIQPKQEHDKRLEAFVKVMELENVPYYVGDYDYENFYENIRGLESTPEQGAKCSKCYDMRLDRAAAVAKDQDFDLYATTLAISPHKVQKKLIAFGELNEKRYGVPYFHRNFMQDEGFKDSVNYTREHDIYRQDYCGCFYSLPEGGAAARWLGEQIGFADLKKPTGDAQKVEIDPALFHEYEARVEAPRAQGDIQDSAQNGAQESK